MMEYILNLTNNDTNIKNTITIPTDTVVFSYDYIGDGVQKNLFRLTEYSKDLTAYSEIMELLSYIEDLSYNNFALLVQLKNNELENLYNIADIERITKIDLRAQHNKTGDLEEYPFVRVLEIS